MAAGVAALLALWAVKRGWPRDLGGSMAQESAPVVAASSAGATILARVMAPPASHALPRPIDAPRASAALVPDDNLALAQRMKADWCGFGAAEQLRLGKALYEKAASGIGAADAMASLNESVSSGLLAQASAQVLQHWIQALQRGDPRSQALADYLSTEDEARARLQQRARSSTDPMVTALALLRPCAAGGCANVEASQWSRLEPANLQAWLALLNVPSGAGRAQQAYVLERAASETRYSRSYQQEAFSLLLGLPQSEAPGLMGQAEIDLINGIAAAWPIQNLRPLLEHCRSGPADSVVADRCATVASMLWQQGDQLDRGLAIALARAALPGRPGLRPQWEPRAREYEAVSEWGKGAMERVMNRLIPDMQAPSPPCQLQPVLRQMQQEAAAQRDWERARMEMRQAGANEAELAGRWRQAAGRSALDPLSPRQPASASKD